MKGASTSTQAGLCFFFHFLMLQNVLEELPPSALVISIKTAEAERREVGCYPNGKELLLFLKGRGTLRLK